VDLAPKIIVIPKLSSNKRALPWFYIGLGHICHQGFKVRTGCYETTLIIIAADVEET
jgi:hypothetical protein